MTEHRHLPLITTSEMKAYRRCRQKHHLGYRLGYREVNKAGPLRFGTAVHAAREVWWSRGSLGDLDKALAAIDAAGDIDPFERAKARAMFTAYHARWIDAQFTILGVEVPFVAPLVNPKTGAVSKTYQVGGKIDSIIKLPNGDVYITEFKTTGVECTYETPYWKKLRLDTQISNYYLGARALGYNVKGCLYDVARKPPLRPSQIPVRDENGLKIVLDAAGQRVSTKDGKKWRETADAQQGYVLQTREETPDEFEMRCLDAIAEDPDRYLVRGEVHRLESDERDAAEDLWHTAKEMRENELAERHPRNPDGCEAFGRFCEFWDYCTGIASLDDPTRYRRAAAKHEELTTP